MKKLVFLFCLLCCFSSVYAGEEGTKTLKGGYAEVPAAKRPKPADKEKAALAAQKDESKEDENKKRQTIM